MAPRIRFILNDRLVESSAPAGLLLLDFLRVSERLTGTKEGCKEGDCGACAVLIGELTGGAVRYQPVTACLVPLAEVHGRHVVTIEGCNLDTGLTPVQEAVVEHGGTQCGFCTPGIVVSLHGLLLDDARGLSLEDVKYALSGHLCRCTGYRSLKDCAETLDRRFGSRLNGTGGADGVSGANHTRRVSGANLTPRVAVMASAGALPDYFTTIPERLRDLRGESHAPEPEAEPEVRIAGGTDLYVQQGGEEIPDRRVEVLNRRPALKGIRVRDGEFRVGALTTFEEFGADQQVIESIPRIGAFSHLIASWQIRNRATLSGNIVNASPIGDLTALLLALDARVVLDDGGSRRSVSLKDFYHGYKQMDLRPGELVTEVAFADPADSRVNFEKVSKRTCLDIASVNSACTIRCIGDTIIDAHVSLGGVAPIPLYLHETSQALRGRNLDQEAAWDALRLSQQEIAPITDVRGSAEYKRLLARQLLIAHFVTLFPERFAAEAFYAGGLS